MKPDSLPTYRPMQLAGLSLLAVFTSSVVAVAVLLAVRRRQRMNPSGDPRLEVESVPVQPAVNTTAPASVPDHFSEEVLVPGFTQTGADVLRDDSTTGRSPEGV